MMDNEKIQQWIDRIDTELVRYFAEKDPSCSPLDRAMEYTLLAGGKRLRSLLTLVVVDSFGGSWEEALPFSLASEFIHTYSLIHDDLPAMDNDDMRRGKPTNHVLFGEGTAILAGDALQAEAVYLLASTPHKSLKPEKRLKILAEMADAIGRRGMVAGQVMDLAYEGKAIELETLLLLHRRKTGLLIRYCLRLGAYLADLEPPAIVAITVYAEKIGLLFQVVDDILDEEQLSETLGKTAGKDKAVDKATFLKVLGSDESHRYADQLLVEAIAALKPLGQQASTLAELARFMRHRES